jgi:Tol biopolymer transport system component
MSLSKALCRSILMAGLISTAHATPQIAQLVSKPPDPDFFDGFGNGFSSSCTFSEDGQRLAFTSSASNLVEGDSNQLTDVFVSDRESKTLSLISRTTSGELANGSSNSPAISGNGRFVLFRSTADNLGVSGSWQGFRHDLETGINTAVGFAPDGTAFDDALPISLSFDGSLATFEADDQAWLRDIDQGVTTLVSLGLDSQPANASVSEPQVSSDGSTVVFDSAASNLVADDTNDDIDVFIHDLVQSTTVRILGQGGRRA